MDGRSCARTPSVRSCAWERASGSVTTHRTRGRERGIMDRTPSSVFLQSFQSRAAFVWRIHAMSVSSEIVYRRRLLDVEIAVLAEIVLHAVETARESVDLATLSRIHLGTLSVLGHETGGTTGTGVDEPALELFDLLLQRVQFAAEKVSNLANVVLDRAFDELHLFFQILFHGDGVIGERV